ncbi:DinB family protein [Paenibacillus chondroitinus]|uniref:DinB family protein n=1 Tax=Paenibacillus chondroitinus TaxID=59842 RepID=A0ABU6DJU0_9BACL|nr:MULTISPECIES: DinB family protein [Paenibacillus]MCY9661424.1 DinB family protein [Paenibacillus anseongense]MEB4797087.1 DinB family protein [Paenibacillus chondroitinus]
MFRSIQDFVNEWKEESTATQRVLDTLTDASLKQQIAPDFRTLGQLAWHIATTIHEMLSRVGLEFEAPEGDEHAPDSAKTIADAYRATSAALTSAIQSQWIDTKLTESTDMYGQMWLNATTLRMLISHEIHHRGEMIVLMRQAGLRVPDIYGPTREDWLERGMQPLV